MSRVDPRVLAAQLGVNIAHAERAAPPVPADVNDVSAVDLAQHPVVADALAKVTGDRSADTMRVAAVCFDDGLSRAQSRWAIRTRSDLAERLDELLARAQPDRRRGRVLGQARTRADTADH